MTSRVLPRHEWDRLAETELGAVCQYLDSSVTSILVVEDDQGAIVGCWSMFPVWHVEGVWVAPAHRGKASVARRLLQLMRRQAQRVGAATVMTGCLSPMVRALLTGLGATALPGEHFVIPIPEVTTCRPQS